MGFIRAKPAGPGYKGKSPSVLPTASTCSSSPITPIRSLA